MTEEAEITIRHDASGTTEAVRSSIETGAGRVEFAIVLGDITDVKYDAIVTPANHGLEYVGIGIQKAIARKAGMETFEEAKRNAKRTVATGGGVRTPDGQVEGVPLGFATAATAGKLKDVKKIIHVNNMRVDEGLPACDEEVVRLAVRSSLAVADSEQLQSVAFPAMGTGVWGMSMPDSLSGTIQGLRGYMRDINQKSGIKKVGFVIHTPPSAQDDDKMQKILSTDVPPKLSGE